MPEENALIVVTWLDAWFDFELRDVDAIRKDYYVTTVGFLIDDQGKVLSLAQEVLPGDEGFRSVTNIPKQLVFSIDRIEYRTELKDALVKEELDNSASYGYTQDP